MGRDLWVMGTLGPGRTSIMGPLGIAITITLLCTIVCIMCLHEIQMPPSACWNIINWAMPKSIWGFSKPKKGRKVAKKLMPV